MRVSRVDVAIRSERLSKHLSPRLVQSFLSLNSFPELRDAVPPASAAELPCSSFTRTNFCRRDSDPCSRDPGLKKRLCALQGELAACPRPIGKGCNGASGATSPTSRWRLAPSLAKSPADIPRQRPGRRARTMRGDVFLAWGGQRHQSREGRGRRCFGSWRPNHIGRGGQFVAGRDRERLGVGERVCRDSWV
jgi:hypothetical protein